MGKERQEGGVLIMAMVLILLVLGLSGGAFSLYQFSREKVVRPFQVSAATGITDRSREEAMVSLQAWVAREAVSDPQWAFFFTGGDLNGDGLIARDGEVDWNRNGKIDFSPVIIRDAADRIVGRRTLEDVNGNHREDRPDGVLEDLGGNSLGNDEDTGKDGFLYFNEPGYDPITNPDPNGDDYHPIFNPAGTEGNGKIDSLIGGGNEDANADGKLNTIEDGSRWIRWGRRVRDAARVNSGGREVRLDEERFLKVIEVNSRIDLNGPDHLIARLLNNLFRAIRLKELFIDPNPMTNPKQNNVIQEVILGQNGRGLEYDPNLDAEINSNGTNNFASYPAHAVKLINARNQFPGKRFRTKGQFFETVKQLGLWTVSDADEWLRLRDLVTVHAVRDSTVVRQDPAGPTGPPIVDPRVPVNLNTAPREVLEAVVMAGIDRNLVSGATADDLFAAAEVMAQAILEYRMGVDGAVASCDFFLQEGSFKTWSRFENDFIKNLIDKYVEDTGTCLTPPVINPVAKSLLQANHARLIAQANANTRLQRFNPDAVTVLSMDKSQIRFPTTEFTFSGDGIFEIDSLGALITGEMLIPPFMEPTQVNRVLSPGGSEVARRETISVVRVFDVLRHTTQADFEGAAGINGGTRFAVKGFPENGEDVQFTFDSAPSATVTVTSPGVMAIDKKTGLVYVASDVSPTNDDIQILNFDQPMPGMVGSIPSVPNISGLVIAPDFPGTTLGRLYIGASSGNKVKVFDIGGNVTSPVAAAKAFHDLTTASTPQRLVRGEGWDVLFTVGTDIEKTLYPFADAEAIPERDDPATTTVNEAANCPTDEDGDGTCDDQAPNALAVAERDNHSTSIDERFDGVDTDGDGVVDDAVFPFPAKPIASSMDTSTCTIPPPVTSFTDLVYDRRLHQAFAVDASHNLWRIRTTPDGGLEARDIVPGACTLQLGFSPRGVGIDEERGEIFVTEVAAADLKLHRYSTKGEPGSLTALETLTLPGLNGGVNDGRMVVDPSAHLIFLIASNGTRLRVVDHRGEALSLLPASCGPLTGVHKIALDLIPRRVFAATATSVAMCGYSLAVTATPAKRFGLDGHVRLDPGALPAGDTTKILLQSNLENDFDLMRRSLAMPPTGAFQNPLGTIERIGSSPLSPLPPQGSLFESNRVKLVPDGVVTLSEVRSATEVTSDIVSYNLTEIFGEPSPGVPPDAEDQGLRRGSMEFWVKLDRLTNPWAIPEVDDPSTMLIDERSDNKDSDGDGVVDDSPTHPAGQPEGVALLNNGIDDDGDGLVDDQSGIDPAGAPHEVMLYRFFEKADVNPFVFIQKGGAGNELSELQVVLTATNPSAPSVDPTGPLPTFEDGLGNPLAMADFWIFSKLSLSFPTPDSDGDGLVDSADLKLERFTDLNPPPSGLKVRYNSSGLPVTAFFMPVQNNNIVTTATISPSAPFPLNVDLKQGGAWMHIGFAWNPSSTVGAENIEQQLFVNGAQQPLGTSGRIVLDAAALPEIDLPWTAANEATNLIDDDGDGAVDESVGHLSGKGKSETNAVDLLDGDSDDTVDDGFLQGSPFLQFGAIVRDAMPPLSRLQVTIDDIVFYDDETAITCPCPFTVNRFSAQSEPFMDTDSNGVFDPGEPFQDFNLDGKRNDPITEPGDLFTDQNDNGIYDAREPFGGYYPALTGSGRYDFYGERYFDQGGNAQFDVGEPFEDFNRSGQFDLGELYQDTNKNGQHDGGETFPDQNGNRIYDGNGYLANPFSVTVPAGSRIGTLTWTEYKPTGTAINVTLTLKATDGRTLWQWLSDNNSAEGVPVNLTVPEESRLEYRVNFMVSGSAAVSPVLDDLTVSVISEPQVLYSQEISRPFQLDPSLGPVE